MSALPLVENNQPIRFHNAKKMSQSGFIRLDQWRIQEFLKGGAVKQKRGAVTIKIQYFGGKSLESSMKSVSIGGAVAPTLSAVDPPLTMISNEPMT